MRLKEWIRGNGFTYQTFADEIGASKRNVENGQEVKDYQGGLKLKNYLYTQKIK